MPVAREVWGKIDRCNEQSTIELDSQNVFAVDEKHDFESVSFMLEMSSDDRLFEWKDMVLRAHATTEHTTVLK